MTGEDAAAVRGRRLRRQRRRCRRASGGGLARVDRRVLRTRTRPGGDQEHDGERSEDQPVGAGGLRARIAVRREQRRPEWRAALGEDPPRPEVVTDGLEGPARWDHHAEGRAGPRHEVHREDGAREQHGGEAQHRQGERRLGDVADRGGGEQAEAEGRDRAQQQADPHRGVRRQRATG